MIQGRSVFNGMHQVAGFAIGGWQNSPCFIQAVEASGAVNFVSGHTYVFLCSGIIGGFQSGTPGTSDAILALYDSNTKTTVGTIGNAITHRVYTAAPEIAEQTTATNRKGIPFFFVGRWTVGTVYDVILQTHAGSSAYGFISNLCIWYFDETMLGAGAVQHATTNTSLNLPRFPTWTPGSQVTCTWASGTEQWLVAYSTRVAALDPLIAYRTRVMHGTSFATPFIGAAAGSRPIGAAGVGGSTGQIYSLGSYRILQLTSGTDTLRIEAAGALGGLGPQQILESTTLLAVRLNSLDDLAYAYADNVSGLFGVGGNRGGPQALSFTPNTPSGARTYFLSAVCHQAGSGSSWKNFLRANGRDRGGNQSMHVYAVDSDAGLPVMLHVEPELLGNQPTQVDQQGLQNPGEAPSIARPGYDCTVLAASVGSGLVATLPALPAPGSLVVIRLGREAPALTALDALPIEPDFALQESREFNTVSEEMESGHRISWPRFVTPRSIWQMDWGNKTTAEKDTLAPFLRAHPAKPFRWTPGGGVEGAYMALGGKVDRSKVNPGVYSLGARVVHLEVVGP